MNARLRRAALLGAALVAVVTAVAAVADGRPTCLGRTATIVGAPGDDVLRGTPGPDVVQRAQATM